MKYEAIILAAGVGKRMGAKKNKVLLELEGQPILLYTIQPFLEDENCEHIILVGKEEELPLLKMMQPLSEKKISFVAGGAERQESVYEGLRCVQKEALAVLIHDGARPFISRACLRKISSKLEQVESICLGVPVKDTIKRVSSAFVEETIPREDLWQAQTPQAFHVSLIKEAHQKAKQDGFLGTDDVSLIEEYFPNVRIEMLMGAYENIKLTTPEDLVMAKAILENRDASRIE